MLIYDPEHPAANNHGYVPEHRLIVEKVLGRFLLPEEVVHHLDGDRMNNVPENLQVMTNSEHAMLHHRENPERFRGQQHNMARLTEDHVRAIRAALAIGETQRSLATMYGVSRSAISMIALRKRWSYLEP